MTDKEFLRSQLQMYYERKRGYDQSTTVETIKQAISKLEIRVKELKKYVLEDTLEINEYNELKQAAEEEKRKLRAKLSEHQRREEQHSKDAITDEEFETILDESAVQLGRLKFNEKRAIVERLIEGW